MTFPSDPPEFLSCCVDPEYEPGTKADSVFLPQLEALD